MMKHQMPVVKLEKVWKVYKMGEVEVQALKNISLEIFENEFVAIIGTSGSGKSTMMNIIGCLDKPSKGDLYLDGQNIIDLEESDLSTHRGKNVGFIFQQYNLIGTLSVFNNIKLPLDFQEYSDKEADKRVEDMLHLVKLEDKKNNLPSQLSGGQQQRVFIARSLAQGADLYIMDEPFVGVDAATEEAILNLLTEMKNQGKTVIVVHHDLQTAKDYFDWIVLLNTRLVAVGPKDDIFREDLLQEAYGGKLNVLSKVGDLIKEKGFSVRERK